MRKTSLLIPALALAILLNAPVFAQEDARPQRRLTARVSKVYDGVSFQLAGGLRSSLIGVSPPSPGAPGSAQAHATLKRLLENRTVLLEIDERPVDGYGQLQYYVFLQDGAHVNVLMVLRGLGRALVKHPNVRYRKELIEAENIAKNYRRGIWGDEFDPRDRTSRPFRH